MDMRRNRDLRVIIMMFLITTFMGCLVKMNTVETCVLSNLKYIDKAELEKAKQPERFDAGREIYASVYFIESPLGMEYNSKWFLNDKEIKNETKAMTANKHGIINFSLEAEKVIAGKIRFEIRHRDEMIYSKEVFVR